MIDDVICAKKTLWIQSSRIFTVTQNARKRCCWHCNIWPITLFLISKLHTGVCEETFNVNIKIIINYSKKAKYLKFHCWKVKLSAIIREISYSNLETGRYGPKPRVSRLIALGRDNADGMIPFPNSLDPPLSVFTGHFWWNNKKHSQNSKGDLSWIKNIDSTIHSFWCAVKEKYYKILNKSIDPIGNLSLEITCRYHVDEDFIVSMASNQSAQFMHIFICNLNYKAWNK